MVFTSTIFIFAFLPIVLILYFLAAGTGNQRVKNLVLLLASFVFYSWGGLQYTFLILFSTAVNFILGIWIDQCADGGKRRRRLVWAMLINLGVLGFFKYFNFFTDIILSVIHLWNPEFVIPLPRIPLPIGISFFTFQIMTYIIDLYRKEVAVQRNYLDLALYIMLFPQLIAGPIVRYSDINAEISNRVSSFEHIYCGTRRFMIGFSKKMLLANSMGRVADQIFAAEAYDNLLFSWLGVITYGLQIFLDFAAYSDMAIGLGEILGFHFKENFNYPYISRSIKEFWRRWHISLSSFFRDYVYIPLGGNRKGAGKTYRNLLIVFFLTGLWHGASWNFVVWGLWYGTFLILERIVLLKYLERIPKIVQWMYCMVIVLIGWVFFRADTLPQAAVYIKSMFLPEWNWSHLEIMLTMTKENFCWFICSLFICVPKAKLWRRIDQKGWIRELLIIAAFGISLCYLMITDFNPFIYFRF